MATFQIFRETAIPSTLQPSSLYFIAPPSNPDFVEIYLSNSAGTALKRVIQEADVTALIASSGSGNELQIVNTIAERNALALTKNTQVYVVNATGDNTVASGGATYLYNFTASSWIKVSEAESLDLVLSWANITGKPTSNVTDIDNAVLLRHTHSNKTQLDLIGEDINGNLTYNGNLPNIEWTSVNW